MEIRKLDPTEHSATRSLYEEVFSEDSESFVNYYYTEKTKDNIIYAVTEDGEIRSMIHLNPYDVMVNKKRKSCIILWPWQLRNLTGRGGIWLRF